MIFARLTAALITAVIIGGFILFGLLWLWFWFEQNGPSRNSSQDQSGYSSQDQSGNDSEYSRYRNNGDSGYGNGYNTGQGQPIYPYVPVRRRVRSPCYNPCY